MSNRFRSEYRVLSDEEKSHVEAVKNRAEELASVIDNITTCRERSIAHTKLEEAVMFAVKAITG